MKYSPELHKEIEAIITLELKQNVAALSVANFQELIDEDTLINRDEISFDRGMNSNLATEAVYECAERMVNEGKLKRNGRTNTYNQQYLLTPKSRTSAKEADLEARVAKLEEMLLKLV